MWLAYINKESLGKPAERVKAEDHQSQYGLCPQCEQIVQSIYWNKVWQWKHVGPCGARKVKQ